MDNRNNLYIAVRGHSTENYENWKKRASKLDPTDSNKWEEYFSNFFPLSLKLFNAVLEKQQQVNGWSSFLEISDHYDAMITILGLSPAPLLHTICSIKPDQVYLVVTNKVQKKYASTSKGTVKSRFETWLKKVDGTMNIIIEEPGAVVSSINSLDTYTRVREIVEAIRKNKKNAKIAIDVTGGKKSSVVTAFFVAAIQKDIDIFYVDFEEYESRTICGTEFLNKLENPYEVYSIREEQTLYKLWKEKNYSAAIKLLDVIVGDMEKKNLEKYSLQSKLRQLQDLKKAASCYYEWAKHDYHEASINPFEKFTEFHEEALNDLAQCPDVFGNTVPNALKAPIALKISIDRYMRGQDAANSHEWNRAALCYTQAVECLLRFCYSYKNNIPPCNIKKIPLAKLLNDLFAMKYDEEKKTLIYMTIEPFFKTEQLFEKIDNNIRKERNELSHFQCVPYSCKNNNENSAVGQEKKNIGDKYISIMKTMAETIEELFCVFANKFAIKQDEIKKFKKIVNFCSLNENLELISPI